MRDRDGQVHTAVPKDECCGCGACCSGCPTGAIRMEPDGEGFLYPVMADKGLCTNCGRCVRMCPVLRAGKQGAEEAGETAFYAVVNNDEGVRADSSSGGVFSLLAGQILSAGGAVFGAALSEDCRRVEHVCVEDGAGLERLRRSKYLQSDIGTCYQQAEELLRTDRQVLFSGTPCQIEGLRGYLGRDYPGLFCADTFCLGVPSPKLWERYVQYREQEAGAAVRQVSFRDKVSGWRDYSLTMQFASGSTYREKQSVSPYMQAFLRRIALRPSCYHCPFKGVDRVSDVTMADLWGLDDILPEWNDNRGVSLLLVRGEKGRAMFDVVRDRCRWQAVDREAALRHNPMAVRSAVRPPQRDKVFRALDRLPFDRLAKRYAKRPGGWKRSIERFLRALGLR